MYIDGLVQKFSNAIAKALELLQPCTKTSVCRSCRHEFYHGNQSTNMPQMYLQIAQGPKSVFLVYYFECNSRENHWQTTHTPTTQQLVNQNHYYILYDSWYFMFV